MTNMRYGCSGRRKTRFLSLHMYIVQRSFEGDELSFLYCSLLIILDSILYGLMALIVTKVILLMIMMVMLSTPGKVWKSKKKFTCTKTRSAPQSYAPGKPPGRRYARWCRCKAPGPPCRTRRRPRHCDSRPEEGVPPLQGQGQGGAQGTWLLRLSGQRIIVMCCSLSRGSTPPSKRARSRLCWGTTGLARVPRSA